MKIKIISPALLNRIVCLILLVIVYTFFGLKIPYTIYQYSYRGNMTLALLAAFVLLVINFSYNQVLTYNEYYNKRVLMYLGIMSVELLITFSNHSSAEMSLVSVNNILFLPVFYYAFSCYIDNKYDKLYELIRLITIVNIICIFVYAVQCFMYQYNGVIFLNISKRALYNGVQVLYFRNGRIRIIDSSDLILFSYLLSLIQVFSYKERQNCTLCIVNVIASLFSFFYIQQTRSIQLIAVALFMVIFLFYYHPNNKNGFLIKKITVFAGIVLILLLGGESFINRFSVSKSEGSYFARVGAIQYYSTMLGRSIFSGFGFLNENEGNISSLIHGPFNYYYPDDVGIIGTWVKYGLVVVVWYASIIVSTLKKSIASRKYKLIYATCFFFLLLTSITLSLLDNTRIVVFAMLLVLLKFISNAEVTERME